MSVFHGSHAVATDPTYLVEECMVSTHSSAISARADRISRVVARDGSSVAVRRLIGMLVGIAREIHVLSVRVCHWRDRARHLRSLVREGITWFVEVTKIGRGTYKRQLVVRRLLGLRRRLLHARDRSLSLGRMRRRMQRRTTTFRTITR